MKHKEGNSARDTLCRLEMMMSFKRVCVCVCNLQLLRNGDVSWGTMRIMFKLPTLPVQHQQAPSL